MYLPTAFGITIGYHRLFTHRAFEAKPWVRYTFAVLGSMAVQGSVIDWVADHRKHHAFTDKEGDPHSPHGHGDGLRGALSGLWYAHMGWLVDTQGQATKRRFAPELLEDPVMRRINYAFLPLVGLSLLLPFALGFVLTGTLAGGLTGTAVGRVRADLPRPPRHLVDQLGLPLLRPPALRGRRTSPPTSSGSRSRPWASPGTTTTTPSPAPLSRGMRWWEIDISAAIITLMEKLGLAWNVIRISPERQQQRLAGAAAPRRGELALD